MKKELKDFIHLYLGCECKIKLLSGESMIETLTGVTLTPLGSYVCYFLGSDKSNRSIDDVTPILRPLSDMTEEEMLEYGKCVESLENCDKAEFCRGGAIEFSSNGFPKGHMYPDDYNNAESFRYLLSKHFDLFGLIEAGLAIDKTKL